MAYKILVVDDEKLIVKGIKFSLEQDGMEIEVAYDGEEALNLIRKNKYDLAVLDVMLPKMDGLQVCREGVFADADNYGYGKGRGHGQNYGSGIRRRRLYDKAFQYFGIKGENKGCIEKKRGFKGRESSC